MFCPSLFSRKEEEALAASTSPDPLTPQDKVPLPFLITTHSALLSHRESVCQFLFLGVSYARWSLKCSN